MSVKRIFLQAPLRPCRGEIWRECSRMYWIYDYPRWAIAILFVAVFAGVTWTGIFLTRATVHSWIHREKRANEMVGLALSSFFVLFGLLLGLVAVATYQNYSNVTDTVDKEASSIAALDRDFNGFPQPVRGQLKDRLAEYARLRKAGRSSARASYQAAGRNASPRCFKFYRPSSQPRKAKRFSTPKPCGSSIV
jgi:hypothetical protein